MIIYVYYKSILLGMVSTNQFIKNYNFFQKSLKNMCPLAKSHHWHVQQQILPRKDKTVFKTIYNGAREVR